ncbi:MAG: PhzF family phenazine biosynthesis protein [Candidatus Thermoplasmatota archaeon]|nr:PhzF family phenazine biosynthesis protein [Candidatus Thermoplasmatota archaeon]
MKKVRYERVDVFANRPFGGNPLAVFPDARGLTTREMQLLAMEMNLSETTFVLPPSKGSEADFRVRIFVPDMEIPYAGHPTIGTFYVLARAGRIKLKGPVTTVMMEVKAGIMPVEVHASGGRIRKVVTVQNLPEFGPLIDDVGLIADALSLNESDLDLVRAPPQYVSTGLPWVIVPVKSRREVEKASGNASVFTELRRRLPNRIADLYVTCLDPVDPRSSTHSRGLSLVARNVVEDPATGSASGCLGAYLVNRSLVPVKRVTRITNEQGYEIGRPSKIAIEVRTSENGAIEAVRVGGTAVHVMDGNAYL